MVAGSNPAGCTSITFNNSFLKKQRRITMNYHYVPIILDYFNSGLNWKADSKNKRLMEAKTNRQARKEAAKLYELEKEKNLGFGKDIFSLFSVNNQQKKDLSARYPKEAMFLGLEEPQLYISVNRKVWNKTPVIATYTRA
jgi:hypothetical protein